jgi:hypothetical protein
MKAVFSFRSKPFAESCDRRMAGFYSDHYFIVSFKLAIHCAKKSFDRVELYTDKAGYDLLIRDNQLLFDKVHVVLDDLDDLPSDLWMAGKLYTYSLQDEPFIHLDYDLFLLEPIPQAFLDLPALVQCEEPFNQANAYKWGIDWVTANNRKLPLEFYYFRNTPYEERMAHNMGLVGGQAYQSIADYGKKALQMLRANLDIIIELPTDVISQINIVYEQYFFTQYMGHHNIPVTSYMPYAFLCCEFNNETFVHILSTVKSSLSTCMKMEEVYLSRIDK